MRALCALLLLGGLVHAAETRADPKIDFERYTLPNGLEVILVPDRTTPIVFVSVWYHVGSGDDTPGRSGFAHLFEHTMFQGAEHTGEDAHFKILERAGVSTVNGTTNNARTNYFEEVPSNQLETALWLESDRMGYLEPGINEKSLDNQREVVKNERRQRLDNVPYGKERFALAAALYPEGHPYRYLTIGKHEDITNAQVADVKAFFEKWYAPANATLCLAGDFDPAEARRLVEKWFGSFPKTERPAHAQLPRPVIAEAKRITVEDDFARLRRLHYAWFSPLIYQPGDAELDVLANALGSKSGRLRRILVNDRQLARNVAVFQQSDARSSTLDVIVDLNPSADLAEVERIVDEELGKVTSAPIDARELGRALVAIESSFIWGLESVQARAELLQSYNHFTGDPGYIKKDLERYRSTTPDKVLAVAKQYLGKEHRVEVVTMPKAAPAGGAK
jgi:predicted Zn-dependent peptidase